jgi:hypothetical protein
MRIEQEQRNVLAASKFGLPAIVANGGAASFAERLQ